MALRALPTVTLLVGLARGPGRRLPVWMSAQSESRLRLVLAYTRLATVTQLGSSAIPSEDWMDPLTGFLVLFLCQAECAN